MGQCGAFSFRHIQNTEGQTCNLLVVSCYHFYLNLRTSNIIHWTLLRNKLTWSRFSSKSDVMCLYEYVYKFPIIHRWLSDTKRYNEHNLWHYISLNVFLLSKTCLNLIRNEKYQHISPIFINPEIAVKCSLKLEFLPPTLSRSTTLCLRTPYKITQYGSSLRLRTSY